MGSPNLNPVFLGPRAKIKNLLPIFFAPYSHFRKGMTWPCRIKRPGRRQSWQNSHFLAHSPTQSAGQIWSHTQKLLEGSWTGPEIFIQTPRPLKSYIIFSWGQTDRYTTLYTWDCKISPPYFLPSHSLCLFNHFVREDKLSVCNYNYNINI